MEPINVVIDISHWNNVASFVEVKNDGVMGVIHKATEGFDFTDPAYLERRSQAQAAGLMWGSYHFGVGGDGVPGGDVQDFRRPRELHANGAVEPPGGHRDACATPVTFTPPDAASRRCRTGLPLPEILSRHRPSSVSPGWCFSPDSMSSSISPPQ